MMNLAEQGLYIRMLATAWEQPEQGTLPLPIELTAKLLHVRRQICVKFVSKWTQTWVEKDGKLVNERLRAQAIELQNYMEKQSLAGKIGNDVRWHGLSQPHRSPSPSPSPIKEREPETTDTTCGNVENYSTNVKTSLMKIANQMQTYAPISDREQERRRQKQKLQLERYLKTTPARRAKM